MKKCVLMCLVLTLFLSVLVGCRQAGQEKNEESESNQESATISEEEYQKVSSLLELYKKNITADITKSRIYGVLYWDYNWIGSTTDDSSDYKFAVVDMNDDGLSEIVLERLGEHCIIYYNRNIDDLKTLHFGFREMYYINENGTFSWNDTSNVGYEYGLCRLDEDMNKIDSKIYLWTIRNDGTDFTEFFINNVAVTKDEWDQYSSQFESNRIEFYDLTSENLTKYITFDSIYNANNK